MTAFFPAVHTVDASVDWLLQNEVIPHARLFRHIDREWELEVCNPKVDTIIDFPTLQAISREVYSEGYCADMENRCRCVQTLFDIGNAMAADGRIVNFPSLSANLGNVNSFMAFFFSFQYGYNVSNEVHRKMGSEGQPLMQQMLANAQLHMQGKSAYKLYHYSAHDTTLGPVAATLGDLTPLGILPPFAQLYAFELLYDDEANAYSMRVMRGNPGQTPETNYEFAWDDFTLKCMDSNGAVYEAANNTCPFYDFQRFVDSSKPTDPAGLCYLDDRYKSLLKCPAKDGEVDSSECRNYRALCPAWACDADSTLDPVTLQCKCSAASCMGVGGGGSGGASNAADNRGLAVSAGAAAGIAIATFAVGVLLGLFGVFVWARCSKEKDAECIIELM
ncbi:putative membrane-bound acid phosphatase 2 [Trypanosoma grayi]|uniref:putative membrane-bound acid phosphatase 2 n=1 Tax=Trypanosoma grayi TaxID=71804 RepID=UPI0004F41A77|nr:putative membrane-bound acid phosphatase 2 [Trypanosoma grayi]KEG06074.1 putative membrane-bound acid phosphatase 2 [Trypanosoma grayi]